MIVLTPRDCAALAAHHYLGSCETIETSDFGDLLNDMDFCVELDSRIMSCETCGWWVETHEIDDDGNCVDCAVDTEEEDD